MYSIKSVSKCRLCVGESGKGLEEGERGEGRRETGGGEGRQGSENRAISKYTLCVGGEWKGER